MSLVETNIEALDVEIIRKAIMALIEEDYKKEWKMHEWRFIYKKIDQETIIGFEKIEGRWYIVEYTDSYEK